MNRKDPGQYWWAGVDTDRTVALTGWIGDTPEGEAAFLLLYPTGGGAEQRMRKLAEVLELRPASAGAPVATHQASATIEGGKLTLRFPGFETTIPVHADYIAAARRGWGLLTVGMDEYTGHTLAHHERYVARNGFTRVYFGRIIIQTN